MNRSTNGRASRALSVSMSRDAGDASSTTTWLDPPANANAPRGHFVALVRCSRAQLARWRRDPSEIYARIEGGTAAGAFHEDDENGRKRTNHGGRTWMIRCKGVSDTFASIEEDGTATVVRGDAFEASDGRSERALRAVGFVGEKLRPRRTLEDGTAARVKQRGEEELREKHERHLKVVDVSEARALEARVEEDAEPSGRTLVRRDLDRWAKIVAASVLTGSGGDFARVKHAVSALLFERPLSENAIRDCVGKGFALCAKRAPSPKLVRDAVKQVGKLQPPGRYELLGTVKRAAEEQSAMLTASARGLKLPSVTPAEAPSTTGEVEDAAEAGEVEKEKETRVGGGEEPSVPTPPLQEPPKVLRKGVTMDLGDQSPSLDLEPNAHAVPRAFALDIPERAKGDVDDAWTRYVPSPSFGEIETEDELEAVKAMYGTKYATYVSIHARLSANADEYEELRRGQHSRQALERFTEIRRERYSRMRSVFDALHDELENIRFAVDAFVGAR